MIAMLDPGLAMVLIGFAVLAVCVVAMALSESRHDDPREPEGDIFEDPPELIGRPPRRPGGHR